MREIRAIPVVGLPEIEEGAPLGELIAARGEIEPGDVLVVCPEDRLQGRGTTAGTLLRDSTSAEARKLAAVLGKEPALVELILEESSEVLRAERGVLIVETHHGFICANAGIDSSNIPDENTVCLLPEDPDASARKLRAEITAALIEESGRAPPDKSGECPEGPAPTPHHRGSDLRQLR